MSRSLPILAILALLFALGAAQLKISQDTAAALAEQQAEPGLAPPPLAPSGLDGRPLDANITINPVKGPPKGGPKQHNGPPPSGGSPKPGRR